MLDLWLPGNAGFALFVRVLVPQQSSHRTMREHNRRMHAWRDKTSREGRKGACTYTCAHRSRQATTKFHQHRAVLVQQWRNQVVPVRLRVASRRTDCHKGRGRVV